MSERPQDITSQEKLNRILSVKEMLSNGFSRSKIIQSCSDLNLTDRAIDNYIADAKEMIKSDFDSFSEKESMVALIWTRLEKIYEEADDLEDLQMKRNVLKDIRDLLGADSASKIDHTTKGEKLPSTPANIVVTVVPPKEHD